MNRVTEAIVLGLTSLALISTLSASVAGPLLMLAGVFAIATAGALAETPIYARLDEGGPQRRKAFWAYAAAAGMLGADLSVLSSLLLVGAGA